MTKPKQVAKTLKEVLNRDITEDIINRQSNVYDVTKEVLNWWNFDLYSRRPGPAYTSDDVFTGTDLDMAAFLYALTDRGAVIKIPEYKKMRQTKVKENQMLTSKENRHGKIIGLSANKETFSFSIRLLDMNVMGQLNNQDYVGDYRNFSLTDLEGNWYDGWKVLQFLPSYDENNFLNENRLWDGNTVTFTNFIHPNRWISLYGQYYFITKLLINRLVEQSKDYYNQIQRMLADGIQYPPSDGAVAPAHSEDYKDYKSIKVNAFEVEVDIPENDSEYPIFESNQENLVDLTKARRKYVYNIIPKLRFMTRSTELAFYKYGYNNEGKEKLPKWLKNVKWERDFKFPKKKKSWDRMVLFQPEIGKYGVSIRKRCYTKTERVSESY